MKTFTLFILSCLLTSILYAQTPIHNGEMEEWRTINGYEEPLGPNGDTLYWAHLNRLSLLSGLAPTTLFKESNDVWEGDYAVRLTSGNLALLPIGAILCTGVFEPDIDDLTNSIKLGQPFADKPSKFSGYYQYLPEGDDACAITAQLTKYNTALGQRDTIAEANFTTEETIDSYTLFDLEFEYYSEDTPDTIVVVFTPSLYANELIAFAGSTLYIDGVNLSYEDVAIPMMPEKRLNLYPNPANQILYLDFDEAVEIRLFSSDGSLVKQAQLSPIQNQLDTSNLPSGVYLYQLFQEDELLDGGKIEIAR